MCNEAAGCKRKVCFFAHKLEELRVSSVKVGGPEEFAYDGLDPFSSSASNKAAEAILQQMGLGLAKSPSSSLDHLSMGSCSSSRRSSIQMARQRPSIDQSPNSAAVLYGRTSVDLATAEMNLQKLTLAAAQAQRQLQHASAIHNLAAALTQIQLGSIMSMPDPQLMLAQQIMLQQDLSLTAWNGQSGHETTMPPLPLLDFDANLSPPPANVQNPLNSFLSAPDESHMVSGSPKVFASPWSQLPQESTSTSPFGSSKGLYF